MAFLINMIYFKEAGDNYREMWGCMSSLRGYNESRMVTYFRASKIYLLLGEG